MTCSVQNCLRSAGKRSGLCKQCNKSRWRKANRDKENATERRYKEKYPEKIRAKWAKKNERLPLDKKEANKKRLLEWLSSKTLEERRKMKQINGAMKQERLERATPKWVNKKELKNIYKNRPAGCEVDHIVPINGKGVCGLHVPHNLQYLSVEANRKKGNKY